MIKFYLFNLIAMIMPLLSFASLSVGIGKSDITPIAGTPSAGYRLRNGAGMEGTHDPLNAIALFIDNGEKQIVLCSVDHLGFTYEMTQEVIQLLSDLKNCDIYIGASHTHSGGGAYLNIPLIGESLAGPFDPKVRQFYVKKTAEAILQSTQNTIQAKIGIGYGKAQELSSYRGAWPLGMTPLSDVAVIKVTHLDGTPFAVLFNYPVHPTVLNSENRLFSSDFVGYAREHLQALLGKQVQPLYFNGAQGDINPIIFNENDLFDSCDELGKSLAQTVEAIYNQIETSDSLDIQTRRDHYSFKPQATPFGLALPLELYDTEMNLIVLDRLYAFLTMPGELSTLYDERLKTLGKKLGYTHVSILGLTNDAHGYIILPEAWRKNTFESRLSFGGEEYGESTFQRAKTLLINNAPK